MGADGVVRECRRCGADLTGEAPRTNQSKQCRRCKYITCSSAVLDWIEIPNLGQLFPLAPCDSGGERFLSLHDVDAAQRDVLLDFRAWIGADRGRAQAFFMDKLGIANKILELATESDPSRRGDFYRCLQVTYACIALEFGGLNLGVPPVEVHGEESDRRMSQLFQVTELAKAKIRLRRNEIETRLAASRVVMAKEKEIEVVNKYELAQNLATQEADRDVSPFRQQEITELQHLIIGAAYEDLFGAVHTPGMSETGGVLHVDYTRAWASIVRISRRLELKMGHLRRLAHPDFFATAPKLEVPRDGMDLLQVSCDMLWSFYFPFYPVSTTLGAGEPDFVVTSRSLLAGAQAIALTSRAHFLAVLGKRAAGVGDELKKKAHGETRIYHRRLESLVARRMETAGLSSRSSVDRIDGRLLPCGEIDCVAVGRSREGGLFAMIAEVKDTDLPLQRETGAAIVADSLYRAAGQAVRKANWVKATVGRVLSSLFGIDAADAVVIPVVVTRSVTPLGMTGAILCLSVAELVQLLPELATLPMSDWRKDVKTSVGALE